jgi:hypothetical protein
MHRGHDHHHDLGGGGHSHSHRHSHGDHSPGSHSHGPGHNHGDGPQRVAQWQTPHLPDAQAELEHSHSEADLDLVEKAFVESFTTSSDPTSFLRLARVPFDATDAAGARLSLLRVETEDVTDIGAVMPHLGGGSFRYDPLPASMVSRRKRLRFLYFDGTAPRALSLAEARALAEL